MGNMTKEEKRINKSSLHAYRFSNPGMTSMSNFPGQTSDSFLKATSYRELSQPRNP